MCLLGISGLDLFKISNDKNYVNFTVDIYNKNGLGDAKKGLIYQTPVCGIFNYELAKVTEDKKYQVRAEEIKNYILANYLDKSDVAFFEINPGGGFIWSKNIRQNGLMVELLTEQ